MKKLLFLFAVLLMMALQTEACRYTIREIGYSNLLLEKYKLILHADSTRHHELINDFNNIAFAYSFDANVEYAFTQIETQTPKISFLSGTGDELHRTEVKNTEEIVKCIIHCFSSPVREMLIEEMGNSFAFVLFIEGAKGDAKAYDQIIKEAVDRFKKVSPHLDKAVSEEIRVIKIAYADRDKEEVVLKSLDISIKDPNPFVAAIYGRGRMSGKPLMAKEITVQNIFNKMVLIGTDCECGINLSPLLERSIPLNWPNEARQEAAKMLDFDVDNPMILAEMSGILSKGAVHTDKISSPFSTKIVDVERVTAVSIRNETKNGSDNTRLRIIIFTLAFTILILMLGIFIYLRRRAH